MSTYPKTAIPAIPRIASFFLGSICAVVALVILVEDALKSGHWSLEHKIMPAIVLIAIVSGKLIWDAAKRGRLASFAGFALVFLLATLVIIYTSVGRQGASVDDAMAAAQARAARVAVVNQTLAKNQGMLADAERDRAKECGSGAGKMCNGKGVSVQVYKDAIKGNLAELRELGPEHEAAPLAERSAALLAETFGADKARAKRLFVLWQPVVFALLFELGAIVSFGYSFAAGRSVPDRRRIPANDETPIGSSEPSDTPADAPTIRATVRATIRPDRKANILSELQKSISAGRSIGSNSELCDRYGVARATMSDWLREWETAGLIPERRSIGRCKSIPGRSNIVRLKG